MTITETELSQYFADLADKASDGKALLARLQDLDDPPADAPRHSIPPSRRRWLPAVALIGTAAAVTGVLVVAGRIDGSGPSHDGAVPQPSVSAYSSVPVSPPTRPVVVPTRASAADILNLAAVSAAAAPDVIPRADQFLYVRDATGETWRSMDGTHDGQVPNGTAAPEVVPGCRNGVALVPGNYPGVRPEPCTPDPAYNPNLPTTEAAMVAYLSSDKNPNTVGKNIVYLFDYTYLRPAVKAALFEASTHLPGLTVVDPADPELIGVRWLIDSSDPTHVTTMLFNRTTHAFAGLTFGAAGKAGSIDAPPLLAIVDAVGQRP